MVSPVHPWLWSSILYLNKACQTGRFHLYHYHNLTYIDFISLSSTEVSISQDWLWLLPLLPLRCILGWLNCISFDTAQSIMCVVGRIYNSFEVEFRALLHTCCPLALSTSCRLADLPWTHTVKDSRGVLKTFVGYILSTVYLRCS